jgi:hypothetical protein
MTDRYGEHWDRPFLFLAHTATGGKCCWCLNRNSEQVHHACYRDEKGPIKDREIPGIHVFPICKHCHSKSNPNGCHSPRHWVTRQGDRNRNTDAAKARLVLGYKLLSSK